MTHTRRPVAIVIPTWNAISFTKRCLSTLKDRTDHPAWRVIVVDNGSSDGTVEWLERVKWLSMIRNGSNLGFARACNQGIAACNRDEDVVLLNNDVFVESSNWLNELQDAAYSAADVAIVGTRLYDQNARLRHLGSYMPPVTLRGVQMHGGEIDVNQGFRTRSVESVVFAQAYIRRDCIDQIGVLDEDLVSYFEDSDYCLRAIQAGRRVLCAGSVKAVHVENVTTAHNKIDFESVYGHAREVFGSKWAKWLDHDRYCSEVRWHSVVHEPLGYAVQSRHLMRSMHFGGLRVSYRSAYDRPEAPAQDPLLDDLISRAPGPDAAELAFCQADAFPAVQGRLKIGWSMLEVTGLPEGWVDGCNLMDEIWVPSGFNVETFRSSGVSKPIRVMPLGVDMDVFHPGIRALRPTDRFTFLSVFEWGERKAPEVLLRAFAQEFDSSDDVLLLLSVFNRDPSVDVAQEISALGLPEDLPLVVMLNARLPDYQMGCLYRSADCFVLPSRGEGWGMPVLEAMACGLPVIATQWSGPADFLDETVGYPLRISRLVPAEAKCPYYEGFEWAEPDVEHLKALMREVYEKPEKAAEKGLAASASVASALTWEHAAGRIRERLGELGAGL